MGTRAHHLSVGEEAPKRRAHKKKNLGISLPGAMTTTTSSFAAMEEDAMIKEHMKLVPVRYARDFSSREEILLHMDALDVSRKSKGAFAVRSKMVKKDQFWEREEEEEERKVREEEKEEEVTEKCADDGEEDDRKEGESLLEAYRNRDRRRETNEEEEEEREKEPESNSKTRSRKIQSAFEGDGLKFAPKGRSRNLLSEKVGKFSPDSPLPPSVDNSNGAKIILAEGRRRDFTNIKINNR